MKFTLVTVNLPSCEWDLKPNLFHSMEDLLIFVKENDKYTGWTSLVITVLPLLSIAK